MTGGGGPGATDLDRWRQLAAAATAAPWKVWSHGRRWVDIENNWDEWLFRAGVGPDFEDDMMPADYAEAVANAEFIAEARTAVPALVAAVVAERERADTAEQALNEEIDNRDRAIDACDSLAYSVGTLSEIGEHSTSNDPWANAARLAAHIRAERDAAVQRADTLQRERDRLASAYDDARFAYDTEREGANDLRARVSAAEAALTRIRDAFNEHGHVPPLISQRQHEALIAARAVLDTTQPSTT